MNIPRFLRKRAFFEKVMLFTQNIFIPFLIARLSSVVILWVARLFEPPPGRILPEDLSFWERAIKILSSWDGGWYLSIVEHGYLPAAELGPIQSNIVFFPMYPSLVRLAAGILPLSWLNYDLTLRIVGIVVSNLLLLATLFFVYDLVKMQSGEDSIAQRTVWYFLVFPTSFYFSMFYTESTYLFFVVSAFWAAYKDNWKWMGLLGGLAALTRPPGVLLVIPLFWIYCRKQKWNWRYFDKNIIWFGLIPLGTSSFFFAQSWISGDLLASVKTQEAWGRINRPIWEVMLIEIPTNTQGYYWATLNEIFLVGFSLLSLIVLWRVSYEYGIYAILQLLPQIISGSFDSSIRYCLVLFPVFILLAKWGREHPKLHDALIYIFIILQTVLLIGLSQGYWVV